VTTLLTGISQLATPAALGARRGAAMRELTIVEHAAVAIEGDQIAWVGPLDAFTGSADREVDLGGVAVIPGLVDCHTHCIWAGDRLVDFEARAARL
jgi:imidazolonepropionase